MEETKQWVSQGIIDESVQARISGYYAGKLEYKRLINTVVTLGSILIGLGILLFVASNWDKISRPAKITIIFSVISLFNFAGYYFRNVKNEFPGLGEGFLLIGAFSFGAGIWLIAQMYQIHYNFSAGILFWILGIIPLVYIYRSWPLLSLTSVLSFIWLSSYQGYYFNRAGFGFFPLALILIGFCYLCKQRFSLFVVVAGLISWLTHFWLLQFITRDIFSEHIVLCSQLILVTIYTLFGFILYGLGIWHQRMSRYLAFSFLYKFLGLIFITLPVYSLTFAHHYDKYYSAVMPIKLAMLIVVLFLISIFMFYRLYGYRQNESESREIKFVSRLLALQAALAVLSSGWPKIISLNFNIVLLAEVLGFMYLGFLRHSEGIFRLSIAIFFLDVLSRYFDIFWKMMPRSLLFIFGGIILIGGAIFANRKRKEIEERMFSKNRG